MNQIILAEFAILGIIAFVIFFIIKYIYTTVMYSQLVDALLIYTFYNEITAEEFEKIFNDIEYTGNFLKWLIDWNIQSCTTRENWDKLKQYLE